MNKYVIYTSLTGSYDGLIQPTVIDDDFDYVCYTNEDWGQQVGVWEIRKIPFISKDMQRLSRFPKMHPHVLFHDYEYSLYIDANININSKSFYEIVKSKIQSGVSISGIKHYITNCSYRECFNVLVKRKETNFSIVVKEYRFLQKEEFPKKWGMYEANVILRNHHDFAVISQCELWWSMILCYSKRDQLSYSYSLWKNGLQFDFMIEPDEKRKNAFFEIVKHPYIPKTHKLTPLFVLKKCEQKAFDFLWKNFLGRFQNLGFFIFKMCCLCLH